MRERARLACHRRWSGAIWLLWCHAALAQTALPPAAVAVPAQAPAETTLYLDVKVNGVWLGQAIPVQQNAEDLCLRAADLNSGEVSVPNVEATQVVCLSRLQASGVEHRYDAGALSLEIILPPHWLATQRFDERSRSTPPARSHTGLMLNYSGHVIDGDDRARVGSLWSEWRLFGAGGVLSHTGVHRHVASEDRTRGYVRFDTTWFGSNADRLQGWTVGDLITSAQAWGTPVRVAGIKFSRDFRLRPDLITYPLPQFSGQVAVPSTLDLFINGQRARTETLRPGPYTVTSMPFLTGAGEATLVTTDAVGRQVVTTMPFYASNELLRAGLTDYSVSVGALRRDYGIENFSYGRMVGAGALRVGVTDSFTFEGQVELASTQLDTFGSVGVGAVAKLGMLGVANGAVVRSGHADSRGWQYSFGYRYANRGLSIGYQGTRSSGDFLSLSDMASAGRTEGASNSDIVTLGFSSARFGSAGVSYVRVQPGEGESSQLLNLSWVKQVAGTLSLRIGAHRDLGRDEDMFTAQLIASLGAGSSVSLGGQHGTATREYVQYRRNAPTHGGLGWHAGYARGDDAYEHGDASIAWSGRYAHMEAGMASDAERSIGWADLRGSVLIMGGDWFAARQVSDAFVVVSTNGFADVPVRYENQLIGRTNRRGRLLVPAVTSHYDAKFSVDPNALPPGVTVDEPEQRLVVKRRSGARLDFDVRTSNAVLIRVVDRDGGHLPLGSTAIEQRTGQTGVVGYDGLVYFENLESLAELHVRQPDGSTCEVSIGLPSTSALAPIGPAVCEAVP
jgi:outer membrane usher protein